MNFFTKAPVRFVRVELFVWDELMQFFRRWNEKGEEVGEKRCCNIWKNSQWMILLNWKIKKCVQKKKYYNVLQQPSALLEKIFYVFWHKFLSVFFSNFHSKYGTLCKSMNYKRETRYWKRKCNKTWLINRKFLLFLYFFSESCKIYIYIFFLTFRLITRRFLPNCF